MLSSQKSEQDPKMETVASSLYVTDRNRHERHRQRAKPLKPNTCTSTKAKASCPQKENKLFKTTQYGNIFKAVSNSQCCMELYLRVTFSSERQKDRR